MWSWYIGRWWVGCYIWYSDEGTGRVRSPPRPLLAVPNVTARPSRASVPNSTSSWVELRPSPGHDVQNWSVTVVHAVNVSTTRCRVELSCIGIAIDIRHFADGRYKRAFNEPNDVRRNLSVGRGHVTSHLPRPLLCGFNVPIKGLIFDTLCEYEAIR